jgi:hypothetical protein
MLLALAIDLQLSLALIVYFVPLQVAVVGFGVDELPLGVTLTGVGLRYEYAVVLLQLAVKLEWTELSASEYLKGLFRSAVRSER